MPAAAARLRAEAHRCAGLTERLEEPQGFAADLARALPAKLALDRDCQMRRRVPLAWPLIEIRERTLRREGDLTTALIGPDVGHGQPPIRVRTAPHARIAPSIGSAARRASRRGVIAPSTSA